MEITDNAAQIHEHPFTGPTAFMLGNEVKPIPVLKATQGSPEVREPSHWTTPGRDQPQHSARCKHRHSRFSGVPVFLKV